jgi:hypothetical protein
MPKDIYGWLYLLYAAIFLGMVFAAFRNIPPGPFRNKMAWIGSMTAIAAVVTGILQPRG